MTTSIDPNTVYTQQTLAEVFGVDHSTISRWELAGDLPPGYQLGRSRRWLGSAILADQRRRQERALKDGGRASV